MPARIRSLMFATAVAASLLFAAEHTAAQQPAKTAQPVVKSSGDLDSFLCKDIMRMTGDDRTIATSVLHGYILAKKNTTKYDAAELYRITDAFVEHCLNNPNDKALQAFTKLAK